MQSNYSIDLDQFGLTADSYNANLSPSKFVSTDATQAYISTDMKGVNANQIVVSGQGTATVTLTLPNDIGTTSTPTFGDLKLANLVANMPVKTDTNKQLYSSLIDVLTDITGTLPVANGGTNSTTALTNTKLMVSSGGAIVEGTSSTTPTFASATLTATNPILSIHANIPFQPNPLLPPFPSATLSLRGSTSVTAATIKQHQSGTLIFNDAGSYGMQFQLGGAMWAQLTPAGVWSCYDLQVNNSVELQSFAPSMPLQTDASSFMTTAAINLATQVSNTLPVSSGGTGSNAALANGMLMASVGGAIVELVSSTDPYFNTIGLQSATNQMLFGTPGPNMTTLNVPNPAASQTIRIPDCGTANADIVLTKSAQTLDGIMSFTAAPILSSLTASLPLKLTGGKVVTSGLISLTNDVTGTIDLVTQTSGTLPVTKGGTGLAATTANQLLYSSATSTIAGLATANSGVLITSSGGVPSISTTIPATTQGNITTLGTITTATTISNTTDASSITTGALIIGGGQSVAKKSYHGSDIIMTGANAANTTSGWFIGNTTNTNGNAGLMHNSLTAGLANYALVQNGSGGTYINASTGQGITMGINNAQGTVLTSTAFTTNVPIVATTAGIKLGNYHYRTNNTGIVVPNNTTTKITWDTSVQSNGITYNAGDFKCPLPGIYLCTFNIRFNGTINVAYDASISQGNSVDGSTHGLQSISSVYTSSTGLHYLTTANQTISCYFYQSSGGSITTTPSGATFNMIHIQMISAL